jgi:hypothetical protein
VNVLFISSMGRTRGVAWQRDVDIVLHRVWYDNGTTEDKICDSDTLFEAIRELGGLYSHVHIAEVVDLRSAFKYLGKASDLAETLPEVSAYAIQPAAPAP